MSRTSDPLHGASRLLLLLSVTAAVLGAVACTTSSAEPPTDADERLLTVRVAPARTAVDFQITREYQGQLEPRRRSRIGFDLAGIVQRVAVDEGAEVEEGEPVARLDTQRLEVRKRQLEAAVSEAETSLELARSTLERFELALEREAVSPQDLDEARRREEGAAAGLRRAQAELDGVEVDLAKSTLRAPYHGLVTQRLADEGEAIAPGQTILEVIEIDQPRVRVGVPLDIAARDDLDQQVSFVVGERTVTGRRLASLPEQSDRTRTVDLLFELDRPLGDLRVGQIARLRLGTEQPSDGAGGTGGIVLPSSALTEGSRGLWSALVAVPAPAADSDDAPEGSPGDVDGSDGGEQVGGDQGVHVLESRAVEIVEVGSREGAPVVTVRGGLLPGELVVMEGLHRLVPGQRVRLAEEPAGSPPADSAPPTTAAGGEDDAELAEAGSTETEPAS